jgi:diguanylate cyclase (GGDEF)-like protein/PAS domain S-box-containing protein
MIGVPNKLSLQLKSFTGKLFKVLPQRLASRQAVATVFVALVMGIAISIALITWDFFRTRKAIDQQAEHLLRSYQNSATQASYTLDKVLAEQELDGMFELDAVTQAKIVNEKGNILASRDRLEQQPSRLLDPLLGRELHFSTLLIHHDSFLGRDLSVGRLEITLNGSIAGADFLDRAIAEAIFGLIRNTLLALVILLISQRLVTKPLTQIVDGLSNEHFTRKSHRKISIPLGHEQDEIGFVINALNSLIDKVEQQALERKKIIEAIPDVIFFKDGEGRWLVTNDAAKRLFRLQGTDWEGKTSVEMANERPEMRDMHLQVEYEDEKTWCNRSLTIFNKQATLPDGELRDFEVRKIPSFNQNGERESLVIIGRDVTQAKKAEIDLRIAAIAFESKEGKVVTDANGTILRVNGAYTEITGYSESEVVGKNPSLSKSGRHEPDFYREMWQRIIQTGGWEGKIWNKRKNGDIYPELLSINAVKSSDGSITHYVGTLIDDTQHEAAQEKIETLSNFDSLTGLPNRRLMTDRIKKAFANSVRTSMHGAAILLDIDDFKGLNDTRGHEVGDLLLLEVSKRVKSCVREVDTVSRSGGDEFMILLESLSTDENDAARQALVLAEKIKIALVAPYLIAGTDFRITSSIGIVIFDGKGISVDDILMHADTAMYQAKNSGRNAVRFFDPAIQKALQARTELERDLRKALELDQLQLYYQIQVDTLYRPLGAEALLRWIHPEKGSISPAQFIPLAEESGLILPIGSWVLKTACQQLRAWQLNPLTRDLTLSVNVSAKQFQQADFVEEVTRTLLEMGAKPSNLKLELTESTVLENVEDMIAKMRELKLLGVTFSMDDFGTGYSSLQYLKRLPLDQIKIDQGFVRDIVTNLNDAAIVQTIIAIGDTLGLNVIAEGVETEAQRLFLDKHGCHVFQGYLLGKPTSIDRFEASLAEYR